MGQNPGGESFPTFPSGGYAHGSCCIKRVRSLRPHTLELLKLKKETNAFLSPHCCSSQVDKGFLRFKPMPFLHTCRQLKIKPAKNTDNGHWTYHMK